MIRAVLFDYGQTLVDSADGFRVAEKALQARLLDRLGDTPAPVFLDLYRRMRAGFQERSVFSRCALGEAVLHAFGGETTPGELETWEHEYWETVRHRTRPFPDAMAVLRRLAESFALGLVTNAEGQGRGTRHRLHDRPELIAGFRAIVVAGEAGVPFKPDAGPFLRCLERVGCVPAEAVFVGDDPRIDIEGACDAGLRAVWLRRRGRKHRADAAPAGVPVIETLTDLEGELS